MEMYPWHNALWQHLGRMRSRLPHALILQGRAGMGKQAFATRLAQSLLCEQPRADHAPCGVCQSCSWFGQQNHPDFRRIEPEEVASGEEEGGAQKPARKSQISVDQVRELADFLGLSSHRAGLRVALIHPAEALNQASANALLKMLEEPPPNFLFVLVTHQPHRLLATIMSRCTRIDMPQPSTREALAWLAAQGVAEPAARLAYVGGAPLQALELDDVLEKQLKELHSLLARAARMDPFAASALCQKQGLGGAIGALSKWVHDLASVALAGEAHFHPRQLAALQGLAKQVDLAALLDYQRTLAEAQRHAQHPLNAELQLESLMIQYVQLFDGGARP